MRIGRQRPTEPVDAPVDDDPVGAKTMAWTNGPTIAVRAWRVAILGCLLMGPAALYVAMTPTPPAAPTDTATATTDLDQPAAVSDNAIAVVGAWLEATRTNSDVYTALVPGAAAATAETPATYRNPQVAGLTPDSDSWTVTVAVDIQEPIEAEGDGGLAWIRRYFQVPIYITPEGTTAALAAPAPVAAPTALKTPVTAYPVTVSVTGDVGQACSAFLQAMVAGHGDLSRYISPGAAISPLTPPGYSNTAVKKISASADPELGEGNTVDLLVRVDLTRLDGQTSTTDYVLELSARGGRWEVSAIGGVPDLAPDVTNPDGKESS